MSNIESVVESYIASWNETDPGRRKSALAASCAANASYRDPVMVSDGHAGLDAMLAGVQAKFPGFVLKRISKVDSHNNAVRFAWSLGPAAGPSVVEGVDFATLSTRRQARLDRGLHRQDAGLTGHPEQRRHHRLCLRWLGQKSPKNKAFRFLIYN